MYKNYVLGRKLFNVPLLAILFANHLLFIYGSPRVAVVGSSAEEILAAMRAAMSEPLKYRVVLSGIEMVVYQKMLPNGSLASLTELAVPFKQINIIYDDKNYELYPDHRFAIDRQFLHQAVRNRAATIASSLGGMAAESSQITGEIEYDGKDCYEIESSLTSRAVEGIVVANGPDIKDKIPVKFRNVIEKKTYLMVKTEYISNSGSIISKLEYKDIKKQPGLSDEFFQLPPGFEVKQPKSFLEYMDIITSTLSPKLVREVPQSLPTANLKPPQWIPVISGRHVDNTKRQADNMNQKWIPRKLRTFGFYGFILAFFVMLAAILVRFRMRIKNREKPM